jgi:hypothetical protein
MQWTPLTVTADNIIIHTMLSPLWSSDQTYSNSEKKRRLLQSTIRSFVIFFYPYRFLDACAIHNHVFPYAHYTPSIDDLYDRNLSSS